MNKHLIIALPLLLAASVPAHAEETAFEAAEVHRQSIRLTADGTGIIQNVSCEVCDFSVVKVTASTLAYVNRVQMSPKDALAKSRSNFGSMKFDLETQEVIEFRFFK